MKPIQKIFYLLTITILCISLTSCAGFRKKFVRKKKKIETPEAVVTGYYDYSKDANIRESYKKRFLFWKSWHLELIESMERTYKKRKACYDYLLTNITDMKDNLISPKKEELNGFIDEILSMEEGVKEMNLTKGEINKLRKKLERIFREVTKKFTYKKIEDYINDN